MSTLASIKAASDRVLRAWDAGHEVGAEAMRSAVRAMLITWQGEVDRKGLVSEFNQGNVLLDRLAALRSPGAGEGTGK